MPDEECKRRLRLRNQAGEHDFAPTEADFDLFTSYFVPPSVEEDLAILVHRPEQPSNQP